MDWRRTGLAAAILLVAAGAGAAVALWETGDSAQAPAPADESAALAPTPSPTLAPTPVPTLPPDLHDIDLTTPSPEARQAAEAGLRVAPGKAVVTSVEPGSYRDLLCGRQPYSVEDRPAWAVTMYILTFPISPGPAPQPGTTPTPSPPPPRTMLAIIDAETLTSLQTFSPWPLGRAPGSACR